jgi:hypothetical protein
LEEAFREGIANFIWLGLRNCTGILRERINFSCPSFDPTVKIRLSVRINVEACIRLSVRINVEACMVPPISKYKMSQLNTYKLREYRQIYH